MGYDGQGLGKRSQGILSPIVATPWFKHEGLGFDGRMENPMTMKTIFLKDKDMLHSWLCSSGEGETMVSEGGNPLPPHTSCGGLKEGREISKNINHGKKKNKTKRSPWNETSHICHCYKKRAHNTIIFWCTKACSFCGKKGHNDANCWYM
jgi:hypothetical protein